MGIQVDTRHEAEGQIKRLNTPLKPIHNRLRRNEQLVYDALCLSATPQKAYDLLDTLQEQGLRAPMTIYRALEALIAKDYVKKIESLNAFVAIDLERTKEARAFLICRDCNKTKEIRLEEKQVTELFSPMKVSLSDVRIEAFSDCHHMCEE